MFAIAEYDPALVISNFRTMVRDYLTVNRVRPTLCYMHPETFIGFKDAAETVHRWPMTMLDALKFEGVRIILIASMPIGPMRFQ